MRIATIAFVIILTGCTTASEVVPFGKDTYTLAVASEMGLAKAKMEALKQANEYCEQRHLFMMPVNQTAQSEAATGLVSDTRTTFDFTFRCLAEDDRDFGRTSYDRPDIVIDNRN